MLFTNKLTNKQTNAGDYITYLQGGGNDITERSECEAWNMPFNDKDITHDADFDINVTELVWLEVE